MILLVLIMVISNCTVVFGADDRTSGSSSDNGVTWSYTPREDSSAGNQKDVYANFTALESGTGTYSVDIIGGNTMNTLAAVKNSETWRAGFEQVGNNIYLRIIGDTQPNSRISWILNVKTTAV